MARPPYIEIENIKKKKETYNTNKTKKIYSKYLCVRLDRHQWSVVKLPLKLADVKTIRCYK